MNFNEKNICDKVARNRPWRCLLGIVLIVLISGCGEQPQEEIDTTYGKAATSITSINGYSLLAQELKDRGNTVTVKKRISPSIDRYDIVFWAPNSEEAPSDEAVEAINRWLSESYYGARTFIYVGGHYDAEVDYFRALAENSTGKFREEAFRRIAERKISERSPSYFRWEPPNEECDWFTLEKLAPNRSSDLSGELVSGISASEKPILPYATVLVPNEQFATFAQFYYDPLAWETNVLLAVDGEPMVSSLSNDEYSKSEILLVSNGSFLVNFGLIDPKKEKLASRVLDRLPSNCDVLILESGPEKIRVSESEFENRNAWAWLAEAPFRYIIPHFLFWGVVYCFVKFPIFGRPKQDKPSTSSFRNHVRAIAKQFARSGGRRKALDSIRQYQEIAEDKQRLR